MSQITETIHQKKSWVLVSTVDENTKAGDLEKITPSVVGLVDEWQSTGKFLWSGPFNDNKTGMAIFEATEDEASRFYDKYDKICSGVQAIICTNGILFHCSLCLRIHREIIFLLSC